MAFDATKPHVNSTKSYRLPYQRPQIVTEESPQDSQTHVQRLKKKDNEETYSG